MAKKKVKGDVAVVEVELEKLNELKRDSDVMLDIINANRRVRALRMEHAEKQSDAKEAKKQFDEAVAELTELVDLAENPQQRLPFPEDEE